MGLSIHQNDDKWLTDANEISNYDNLDNFVYQNSIIEEFLCTESKHFIIAGKGVGKTLMLSYKRYLLEEKHSRHGRSSIRFIPDSSYVDFIPLLNKQLSKEQIDYLSDWENCKKLWMFIIKLSFISHAFPENSTELNSLYDDLPTYAERSNSKLKNIFKRSRSFGYIFDFLLDLNYSEMIRFINSVATAVTECFGRIHTPLVYFFDRIDQTIESSPNEIWVSIQTGLVEAAWEVMKNRHIKIYLSIRQEAFAMHHSSNKHSISGDVSVIKYTDEDLKELVNKLIFYYEGKEDLQNFIRRRFLYNTTIKSNENVFSFMNRYSVGRPRDFVSFCSKLSPAINGKYKNEPSRGAFLKNTIIESASDSIVKNLHSEIKMLLPCLTTIEKFNQLVVLLNCNILTYDELQDICKEFNKIACLRECKTCPPNLHPFCDLYNMGLLGMIEERAEEAKKHQSFKSPYNDMVKGLRGDSEFYFVHPALRQYIRNLHGETQRGEGYKLLDDLLIGDGLPWNEKMSTIAKINKLISKLEDSAAVEFFKTERRSFALSKHKSPYKFSFDRYCNAKINVDPLQRNSIDKLIAILNGGLGKMDRISIFVSYCWENEEHKKKVESFTNMLRNMGFEADMDLFLLHNYPDLDEMMTVGLQKDKVIVVLSESYKNKADNRVGGVWKEFKMIADKLEENPTKFIFVSFDAVTTDLKNKISPQRIGSRWIVDLEKDETNDYNELVSYING